jgi:hypothetical protein
MVGLLEGAPVGSEDGDPVGGSLARDVGLGVGARYSDNPSERLPQLQHLSQRINSKYFYKDTEEVENSFVTLQQQF